jgi:hypothetical protein
MLELIRTKQIFAARIGRRVVGCIIGEGCIDNKKGYEKITKIYVEGSKRMKESLKKPERITTSLENKQCGI